MTHDPGWLVERLEAWSCSEVLPRSVLSVLWALLAHLLTEVAVGPEEAAKQLSPQRRRQHKQQAGTHVFKPAAWAAEL